MKEALLREIDEDIIAKLELDFFQNNYGNYFNLYNEIDVFPLLKYEAQLLFYLSNILRY